MLEAVVDSGGVMRVEGRGARVGVAPGLPGVRPACRHSWLLAARGS